MTYLVDVNVLCEPTRQSPSPKVKEWLIANRTELVVDPIIMDDFTRCGVPVINPFE